MFALFLIASLFVQSSRGQMCSASDRLALTFDDGPSPYTRTLLSLLQASEAKATFFVLGSMLENEDQKDVLRSIYQAGHDIGIHTMTHPFLTQLSDLEIRN